MVKVKRCNYINSDGTIDVSSWLQNILTNHHLNEIELIHQACQLSQFVNGEKYIHGTTKTCLQLGLEMAELLLDLHADQHTIAAAILFSTVQNGNLPVDIVSEEMGHTITKLILGAERMDTSKILLDQQQLTRAINQRKQLDNIRKMMLAMVEDVRVVLIKLAECTAMIRAAAKMEHDARYTIALEVFHIYAPLANRLGIGQLKWELEDLCFRYLHSDIYKTLAKKLAAKRLEREAFIDDVIAALTANIEQSGIQHFRIDGRAKHIFSIYRKMQRKNVSYEQIYDVSAVRVLVPELEDCYAVLSCVHGLWEQIPEEFDDYIAHPKPNGYRSLHTAVIGPEGRNVEVQIRTYTMHQESELGVAAHWKYKEGDNQHGDYEDKIAWLRSVLEWQQELVEPENTVDNLKMQQIFGDRVYVFTPAGEIIDLPQNATPLDFAYQVHTEVGHRCKGAKINGHIVPLTYQLATGDRIEILTHKFPKPSRDWLNPRAKYVSTSRAKTKIHHYFRKLDYDKHIQQGSKELEVEIKRLGHGICFNQINFDTLAEKFNLCTANDLFAAVGNGDIKVGQVTSAVKELLALTNVKAATVPPKANTKFKPGTQKQSVDIDGVDNLLTVFAGCCKPLPGDEITGFITRGRGISIHRSDCNNVVKTTHPERLIGVRWREQLEVSSDYPVDLHITANERQDIVRDILSILATERVPLLSLRTQTDQKNNLTHIEIQVKLETVIKLDQLINILQQSSDVQSVSRHRS